MAEWNFTRTERTVDEIPAGRYRVRIAKATKAISKSSGNDMLTLELEVSGFNRKIWHNVVFLVDKPEITNRNLTQIFDSFGIADGDFNLANWIGKVGGAETKVDDYGAKVRYFLNKKQQESLPPWQEGSGGGAQTQASGEMTPVDDDMLPF